MEAINPILHLVHILSTPAFSQCLIIARLVQCPPLNPTVHSLLPHCALRIVQHRCQHLHNLSLIRQQQLTSQRTRERLQTPQRRDPDPRGVPTSYRARRKQPGDDRRHVFLQRIGALRDGDVQRLDSCRLHVDIGEIDRLEQQREQPWKLGRDDGGGDGTKDVGERDEVVGFGCWGWVSVVRLVAGVRRGVYLILRL